MTPCEKIGLKVGDKIRVLQDGRTKPVGSILEMHRDDGSCAPWFLNEDGNTVPFGIVEVEGMNYLPEGKGWERVADKSITQQLSEAVAKRDKYSRKADKWAQRFADQAAEVSRIAGELEREIEEATGMLCRIGGAGHVDIGSPSAWDQVGLPPMSIDTSNMGLVSNDEKGVMEWSNVTPEGVDHDDPKTWRDGDVVKAVTSRVSYITVGKEYEASGYDAVGDVIIKCDDDGDRHSPASSEAKFRFVRRPSEQ